MHWMRQLFLVTAALLLAACGGDGDDGPSSNARLSALVVAEGMLDPAFAAGTLQYDVSVTGGTTSARITAITDNRGARLTIDGIPTNSGDPSAPVTLPVGSTDVAVVVTAEDGTTRTYTLTITRPVPGTDSTLTGLSLTAGPLTQNFDPAQTDYDADLGHLATSTRVLATPTDPLADGVSVDGEAVAFGEPSQLLPLAVGTAASTLTVEVTAEDDLTTTAYQVAVSRAVFGTVGQDAYLKATNTDAGDRFAAALSRSGGMLLAGAPEEQSRAVGVDGNQADNTGTAVGAAYLYERVGGVWTPAHYLKAANADDGDRFTATTAVTSELLAVGAPGEQSLSSSADDNTGNAVGAVYLFDPDLAGAPAQIGYLKAANADSGDRFGTALDASRERILVGAPLEASAAAGVDGDDSDNSLSEAGAAYLFEPDADGSYRQTAYFKASNTTDGTNNQFGNAVAIDGDRIAIAAWQEDSSATGINGIQNDSGSPDAGAVYLFEADTTGNWAQTAYVKASNTGQDHRFGASLDLDGDTLTVGAPGENTGQQGSGAVYVFVRDDAGAWSQEALLKPATIGLDDGFGSSVALVGNLLAVGAPGERSDAIGINGGDSNEAAPGSGAVYLFERTAAGIWQQIAYVKASNTGTGDGFGSAVALDGDTLITGAPAEQSAATGIDGDETDNSAIGAGAAYSVR